MRAARDVDGRADLWSLGASLYELLSGTAPFPAESIVTLAYRIANESPPSLRAKRPEIPDGLERVVLRCLERDCARRFPDARSLADALEPYRRHGAAEPVHPVEDEETRLYEGPAIEPSAASPIADESLGTSSVSWGRSPRPGGIARRRKQAVFVAVALAGVGALIAIGLTRGDAPAVRSPTTVAGVPAAPKVAALQGDRVTVALVPLPEPMASDEPPTVSVTDLPSVPLRPVSTAPVSPPPNAPTVVAPKADPDGILAVPPAAVSPKPVAAASGSSSRPAPPGCSPPYYFDEVGLKIFKPECVN